MKIIRRVMLLAGLLFLMGVVMVGNTAVAAPPDDLIITGVIDGPLSGGIPKAVELYVVNDIPDLSIYGLGSANNGGGTDGEEFTFPAVTATTGDFLYVASESTGFTNFFGFAPDYTTSAMSINGDDAIELFTNGSVSDVFGDINASGTGQPWDYLDGWAYRVDSTGPDGTTFTLANWAFSGTNALDGETSNGTAATPFPIGTYSPSGGVDTPPSITSTTPTDIATDVPLASNITINFDENVTVSAGAFALECPAATAVPFTVSPSLPASGTSSFTLDPTSDLPDSTTCQVTVTAANVADEDAPADNMAADYSFSFTTVNPALVCNDPDTLISVIQSNGAASPEDGNVHTIQGIVVGDFQGASNLSGFFVQEEDADADGDPATSEGIFVYDGGSPSVDVNVGDEVQVTGTVDEYFNLTQMTSVTAVDICSTSNSLPTSATLTLPVSDLADLEAMEGMLVTVSQTLYVTNHFPLGRGGVLELSSGDRLYQPTQIASPGAAALAQQGVNNLNRILIDDGALNQNRDPIIYPLPAGLSASNTVRGGDEVTNIAGVLTYSWSGWSGTDAYRIHPTQNPTFNDANVRPVTAPDVGGTLKVASFNVLNYFTTFGSRGADNATEFNRQRDKIIAALVELDADIVGLMEIENNTAAIQDLVSGLNSATAPNTYAYVNTGTIGSDQIRVALIYKSATVSLLGGFEVLDSSDDPAFNDTKNRPMLVQSFTETATGEVVTVAVNHFKSKGSACDDVSDPDLGDGQGNCNGVRTAAAQAIADFLATDPTSSGSNNFLVIGDLNAYAMEDPITTLESEGYTNLAKYFGSTYGYSFDGQWGTLDYAMGNAAILPYVTGAAEWHINADEPISLDYNTNFKSAGQITSLYNNDEYRSSDHDPVVIGLDLALTFDVVINELDPDQPSTDNAGFVELKNISAGDIDLSEYTLELVNGSNDTVYESIDLASVTLGAGAYYLVCFDNGAAMTNCDEVHNANIQNGPDAVGLRKNGSLVDAVSYGGAVTGYVETTAALGDSDTIGLGLSRYPDGTDTNDNSADFSRSCITPGLANTVQNSSCTTEFVEQCSVATSTDYDLGTSEPVTLNFTDLGTPAVNCVRILYFGYGHPNSTANFLDHFWHIEVSPDNAGSTTTFTADLTVGFTSPVDPEDKLCRWLEGSGPGFGWDCATDSYGANSITRTVSGFSDWAVGDNVGPTAVTLAGQNTTQGTAPLGLLVMVLLVLTTAVVINRRRQQLMS